MAQYLRLPRKDQKGSGAACNVLCVQVSCCVPVQRETEAEEETDGQFQYFVHNTKKQNRNIKEHTAQPFRDARSALGMCMINLSVLI